jgi:hypothetical protein
MLILGTEPKCLPVQPKTKNLACIWAWRHMEEDRNLVQFLDHLAVYNSKKAPLNN